LASRIDPTSPTLVGHSLGAEVALGFLNTCCQDPRVGAVVSLAGSLQFNPGQPAFPSSGYFVGTHVPLLLVHGDADTDNPYSRSRDAYTGAAAPKFLETIFGGDHRAPYQDDPSSHPAAQLVATVTVDFLDAYLKHVPGGLGRLTADGNRAGVGRLEAAPS
jgi:pimeloyl-ACP methyl ester carboxylesterase